VNVITDLHSLCVIFSFEILVGEIEGQESSLIPSDVFETVEEFDFLSNLM
jgi:hypothetical protein